MRNLLLSLVVVGLLASSGMAAIQLQFVPASATALPGATVAVQVNIQGDFNLNGDNSFTGVSSIAGVINNTGTVVNPGSNGFAFTPNVWAGTEANKFAIVPNPVFGNRMQTQQNVVGAADPGAQYGSVQGVFVPFASFNVVIPATAVKDQTLGFSFANDTTSSFTTLLVGDFESPAVAVVGGGITVVPEPVTMALLALGGLLVARRRSH